MLRREAIRGVMFLARRDAITAARMSFVLNACNDVSVIEKDGLHNDTTYYRDTTMYFDVRGRRVSKEKFDRSQALLDALEANLHPQSAQQEMTP